MRYDFVVWVRRWQPWRTMRVPTMRVHTIGACLMGLLGTIAVTPAAYGNTLPVIEPGVSTRPTQTAQGTPVASADSSGTHGIATSAAVSPPSTLDRTPYARYVYPGECLYIVRRLERLFWRDKRQDTARYSPDEASPVPGVADSVRTCAARIDWTSRSELQLPSLLTLAVMTGRNELVEPVSTRILERPADRSVTNHALLLRNTVSALLTVRPVPMGRIGTYVRALDALGKPAGPARIAAHSAVAQYAFNAGHFALASAEAKVIRSLVRDDQMSMADRLDWTIPLLVNYFASVKIALVQLRDASALAYFDSAVADLRRLPNANQGAIQNQINTWRTPYEAIGKLGPPVRGKYWYNVGGDTTSFPRRGKVTLLVHGSAADGKNAFESYSVLRRLRAKFGGADFQIVFMTQTVGRFLNQLVSNPDEEAESTRRYFLEYLKLPVTLTIEQTKFNAMANGYRMMTASVNSLGYPYIDKLVDAEIVRKDGRICYMDMLTPDSERAFESVIANELAR